MNQKTTLEQDIIDFALVWAPFGGGNAEDIFIKFGFTADVYFTRLLDLLHTPSACDIDLHQLRTMREVCRARLRRTPCAVPFRGRVDIHC